MNHYQSNRFIYVTSNYDEFSYFKGNREIEPQAVRALIESIKKVGYLNSVIIVNEKMEIIDGQHRFVACKELGLPIYYTIQEGAGPEEMKHLNKNMRKWDVYNFINFFASNEQKNPNYVKLLELQKSHPNVTIMETAMCMSNTSWTRNVTRPLANGSYTLDETEDNIGCLEFISDIKPLLETVQGGGDKYIPILIGLYKTDLINSDQMLTQVTKYKDTNLKPAYTFEQALNELQKVYNFQKRKVKRFRDAYYEEMEKRGARYKG